MGAIVGAHKLSARPHGETLSVVTYGVACMPHDTFYTCQTEGAIAGAIRHRTNVPTVVRALMMRSQASRQRACYSAGLIG